ncbi:hypothetical protein L3X38_007854 [Prunus dulcis]|uniref:Uncharacterized protein n=1 Tax=Prunus dulcis TaxID=3755 RepID=A0AAD4ZVI1_PRUDU|nr:hypothetical protein L3X38_007854 [Prunus dulcis]
MMVKDKNLFDIQFENGILKIPHLRIRGLTEIFFGNLIAYEQCELHDHYINDYVFIMDRLVDSARDVELLVKSGILESMLPDSEASLKQDYFSSPWAGLSIIAAAILVVLTFIQTVCSVMAL